MEEGRIQKEKVPYATVNDKCYRITSQDSEEMSSLQCQREADGRLLLHADHATREEYQSAVICSADTDIFVIYLAFCDKIESQLFQKCVTRTHRRIVDIWKVAATLGIKVCGALIGLHAYMGCDTVSAFAGKGKSSTLKLLTSNKEAQDTFL